VHLEFLGQSSLRVSVFLQWVWTYLTGQRGSRLIVDHHGLQGGMTKAETGVRAAISSN
jgi:NADH:ubiquinone reductase (H+-translocating)